MTTARTDAAPAYNFSAGPAMLPATVLRALAQDLQHFNGDGLVARGRPLLGLSHRDPLFLAVLADCEQRLRALLSIPSSHAVLFFPFGASLHFAALALNLLPESDSALYVLGGYWSERAWREARRYGARHCAVRSALSSADPAELQCDGPRGWRLAYAHYCANETIDGWLWSAPEVPDVPLVADLSSCLLAGPVDWKRHQMVYASAQKNLGTAGLSLVILERSLLGRARAMTPSLLNYQQVEQAASLPNTANVFAVVTLWRMLGWCAAQGGVAAMWDAAQQRSALLYSFLDQSRLFVNRVPAPLRSPYNVVIDLAVQAAVESSGVPDLLRRCLDAAESVGLQQLAGHRSRGGLRASLYNAMPLEGVRALCDFLARFEHQHV